MAVIKYFFFQKKKEILLHPHENQSKLLGYQGWVKILMITLVYSKRVCVIICYTVYLFKVLFDVLQKNLIQHVVFLKKKLYFFFIGNNDWIIQVTSDTIRLLDGVKQVQSLPLDFDSPIVHVSSADPYLIALTEDGEMILISLDTTRPKQPEISIVKVNLKSRSRQGPLITDGRNSCKWTYH